MVKFQTLPGEPDRPLPPKNIGSRKKGELILRWTTPNENGSKVINFILEYKKYELNFNCEIVETTDQFHQAYKGPLKQFTLKKLSPATFYGVRLAAENSIGMSIFSEVTMACTSGCVPSIPNVPHLTKTSASSLMLDWRCDANNEDFYELQMLNLDDKFAAQHGFLTVFHGQASNYTVTDLKRCSEYRFRLRAKNDEGYSQWSETVNFFTTGDLPKPPERLRVKVQTSVKTVCIKVMWEASRDDGGSRVNKFTIQLSTSVHGRFETIYEGEKFDYTLEEKLEPGLDYFVRASCTNEIGSSEVSLRHLLDIHCYELPQAVA